MAPLFRSSRAGRLHDPVGLAADRDVLRRGTGWESTSGEPWLRLEVDAEKLAGRWVELIYDAGLTDAVTRPLLRCVTTDGFRDQILNGAALGRGIWRGRIPEAAKAILISPVKAPGTFAFRIVAANTLSRRELASRGWAVRPKYTLFGFGYAWTGQAFQSERCFRRALNSTPLGVRSRWAASRRRAPEWDGFDALPPKAIEGPHIRVVATDRERGFIERLCSWLHTQPWPNWSLAAPVSEVFADVLAFAPEAPLAECVTDLAPRDLLVLVRPEDDWAPEALGVIGAAALRGEGDVFYGDEEIADFGLRLKPDWSPILARFSDLLGRGWAARVEWARGAIGGLRASDAASARLPVDSATKGLHLRRLLLVGRSPGHNGRIDGSRPPSPPVTGAPCATIVIPTRDRVDLLRNCVESLTKSGGRRDWEAVVVDNGSKDPATLEYLRRISREPRIRVLDRQGPFNFSALCNAGAAAAFAPVLVFLNNDVEALAPDWLDLLLGWTSQPSVGAVGAKLVYPDGRLQHGGVVIGVDGHASHFERFGKPDEPGLFGRLGVPHEVSAVTGACLAVEKAKFDAVGGFDAVNLPVEYSDVDFCLRLAERGWTALVEPAALLVHREAATRRVWRSQEQRYADQVAYFKKRWRERLRDDPYFHPALSLDWHTAALA